MVTIPTFYAVHDTEQYLIILEQTKKSLLRKNVANTKFSVLRKTTLKLAQFAKYETFYEELLSTKILKT